MRPRFFVGLDLGQVVDPTALAVAEQTWEGDPTRPGRLVAHYAIRHLQRWPLGTGYPAIVAAVKDLVAKPPLARCLMAVDQTGVGRAVVDMFRQAKIQAELKPITITAGNAIASVDGSWHVPKKELASSMQALLQTRRIKFAKCPEREALVKELQNFRVKITLAGNETFESWRERDHDDLCFAVMMAVWLAERGGPPSGKPLVMSYGPTGLSPYAGEPGSRGAPWGDAWGNG